MLNRVVTALVVILSLFVGQNPTSADEARYFYDELGRLIGVVDGQNSAAVYHYDEVGNVLKINRFTTTGGNVGIFFLTPGSALAKNPDGTPANKRVEIRGFGYTAPSSSNQVTFNGTNATVVSGSDESLIVTVPPNATTGPVTVTNANGVATSPQVFKVLVPPIITGIDPFRVGQGVVTRGTVNGFNLKSASAVNFSQAGITATILTGATDDKLPVTLSIGTSVPFGLYSFSVTTPSGTTQSGTIKVEVRPTLPTFNVTKVLTVKMPLNTSVPATMAPTGPTSATTSPTTVQMPVVTTVPTTIAPTGPSFDVTAPTTVSVP